MSNVAVSVGESIEEFVKLCGYEVGKVCDRLERDAAFEMRTLRKSGTSSTSDFLKIIHRLLDDESKQMPLTPLSQRGLENVIDTYFINMGTVHEAVKTPEGRRELMGILKKLAAMEQFQLLEKSLLWGGKVEPPVGYTLYRSEQKDAIMNLISGLPEKIRNSLLNATWTYYCNDGFKITGEEIFGDWELMPL
jgi:hypothetical protein